MLSLLTLTTGVAHADRPTTPEAATPDTLKPIVIDGLAVISNQAPIPSAHLVPGSPPKVLAGNKTFMQTADHSARVGIWESGPGKIRLDMQFYQYVRVLKGVSVIRSLDGRSWTFKPGDSFILPKGFKGEAEQKTHFRKEYVDFGMPPAK